MNFPMLDVKELRGCPMRLLKIHVSFLELSLGKGISFNTWCKKL